MGITRSILTMAFVVVAQQAWAPETRAQAPAVEAILAHPKIVKTLEDIKADDDRAFAEQKHITEIPAPPYKEKIRRILSEADAGTRLQGCRDRCRG